MNRRYRGLLALLVIAVLAAGTLAGIRLWTVHQQTSDWTLWPREVPSKVQFASRDYDCGPNAQPGNHTLDGLTLQGHTAGGANIYAQPPESVVGTAITIQANDGVYTCSLMGAP